jgi:ribosomal protein S18 acetylase RimI-like enzyme
MRIQFGKQKDIAAFRLEPLTPTVPLSGFTCLIEEYNEYLHNDALRSQSDHIARTWLLRERDTGAIAAYMSLIADAIKLSATEKELHILNYPFKTIPAMKIAKLAVAQSFSKKYKGIGSFMITAAMRKAISCYNDYCACRFLTVDADIEHDPNVTAFYTKNGFIPNDEISNKRSKTISMRKDIWV